MLNAVISLFTVLHVNCYNKSIHVHACTCIYISLLFSLYSPQTRPSIVPPLNQLPVYSLLSYTKGFMCTSGSGTVHLFEKTEEKNNFKKVRSVSIWVDPSSGISSDQSKPDIDAG